jgi:hypothetical protein
VDSTPPPRANELLRFRRLKVEPGKSYRGWVAGPHFGCMCHHMGATKPCVKAITRGNRKCACENQILKVGWVGYLPHWDEHGRKMVVLFGVDSEQAVSRMTFGQPIKISKANYAAAPVLVYGDQWNTGPCPYVRGLRAQLCIKKWLINLWKVPEVEDYFKNQPVSAIPIPREGPVTEALFDNPPPVALLGKMGEAFEDPTIVNRIAEHAKNGKANSKKKK